MAATGRAFRWSLRPSSTTPTIVSHGVGLPVSSTSPSRRPTALPLGQNRAASSRFTIASCRGCSLESPRGRRSRPSRSVSPATWMYPAVTVMISVPGAGFAVRSELSTSSVTLRGFPTPGMLLVSAAVRTPGTWLTRPTMCSSSARPRPGNATSPSATSAGCSRAGRMLYLGTRRITDYVAQVGGIGAVLHALREGHSQSDPLPQHIVFIAISSEQQGPLPIDQRGEVPTMLEVADAVIYSGLGRTSHETSLVFSEAVEKWRGELEALRPGGPGHRHIRDRDQLE